ncbi:MAG: hypothetical protein ACRYE8_00940 [Janthinobacterium lividum]
MIYSRDPVKNTNKISIFYYFLDAVVTQLDDIEGAFRSTQQYLQGMTSNTFFEPCNNAVKRFNQVKIILCYFKKIFFQVP